MRSGSSGAGTLRAARREEEQAAVLRAGLRRALDSLQWQPSEGSEVESEPAAPPSEGAADGEAPERAWLSLAVERIDRALQLVQERIESGSQVLPEFAAERKARAQQLRASWVEGVEALHTSLCGAGEERGPLTEALFPHRRFERLGRSAALSMYIEEFTRRRQSQYVRRLESDERYALVRQPLAELESIREQLSEAEPLRPPSADEVQAHRDRIGEATLALTTSCQQARLLLQAACVTQPAHALEALELELPPTGSKRRSRGPAF